VLIGGTVNLKLPFIVTPLSCAGNVKETESVELCHTSPNSLSREQAPGCSLNRAKEA